MELSQAEINDNVDLSNITGKSLYLSADNLYDSSEYEKPSRPETPKSSDVNQQLSLTKLHIQFKFVSLASESKRQRRECH